MVAAMGVLVDSTAPLAVASAFLRASKASVSRCMSQSETWVGPTASREQIFRERYDLEASTLRATLAQELYSVHFSWVTPGTGSGVASQLEGWPAPSDVRCSGAQ